MQTTSLSSQHLGAGGAGHGTRLLPEGVSATLSIQPRPLQLRRTVMPRSRAAARGEEDSEKDAMEAKLDEMSHEMRDMSGRLQVRCQ